MKKLNLYTIFASFVLLLIFGAASTEVFAQTQQGSCFAITSASFTYTQNFNSLASAGNSNTLPPGVVFVELGGNNQYTADDGSSSAINTYSYGTTGSSERAFGEISQNNNTESRLGVCFTNNTGANITGLTIYVRYRGEQWRNGGTSVDELDFEYEDNVTPGNVADCLENCTFNDPAGNAGDFFSPNNASTNTALNGNAAANSQFLTVSFNVTINNNNSLFLRWNPANAAGDDDGLAIDDLFVSTTNATSAPVSISGRVLGNGNGLSGALIMMTDSSGNSRYSLTSPFGYYRFYDVPSGDTYIFTIRHKRFVFEPRTVNVIEEMRDFNFNGDAASDDEDSPTKSKSP